MNKGIIEKKDLANFIGSVKKDYRFYGPVNRGAGVSLEETESAKEIELDYSNLKISPKGLFFPQREALYAYEGDEIRDVPPPEEKVVVLGTRPCDARALSLLDKVFGNGDFKDPYFLRRRENTVLISMACTDPLDTCFCTSLGGNPSGTDGSDVLVFDLQDRMLFESCSEKGEAFMKTYSDLFKKPGKNHLKKRDELASLAEKKVKRVESKGIEEKLEKAFDSPLWDSIAQSCLGCAVCTYFCPTCHCFALFDEKIGSACAKTKNWDSCQFKAFTREASGHNPRTSCGQRVRQRIMHKFRYTVQNTGETFCVGCGRCVGNCPVNMDIREIMKKIMNYE